MKKYSHIIQFLIASISLTFHANSYAIIDGMPIDHAEAPYQVLIGHADGSLCGGTLIERNWVLTAAHCVNPPVNDLTIGIGITNIMDGADEIHYVSAKHVHEGYNGNANTGNDIALLQLTADAGAAYTPAKLPTPEMKAKFASPGKKLRATGWGRPDRKSQDRSDTLRAVDIRVFAKDSCYSFARFPVADHELCAYSPTKAACHGDSGGPWVAKLNGGDVIFGVSANAVSIRADCHEITTFTDVTHYVPWITQITGIEPENSGVAVQ